MKKVKFKDWDCNVLFNKYQEGGHRIELLDADDGLPIAVATVNVPNIPLEENEVIIKNYSENEGIYDALVEAKIVNKTKKSVRLSEFVVAPIVTIV